MKIAYFDMVCGASGDMITSALLNSGASFEFLKTNLAKIPLDGYEVNIEKVSKQHISGTKFNVVLAEGQKPRSLADILAIIESSILSDEIKTKAAAIFKRIARAEAKVHGETVETVHFHEVGMTDAIVDICGALICLENLNIEKVFCSPFTVGTGIVKTMHGHMPVPAPATLELIKGYPIFKTDIENEILTPTGAAILTSIGDFSQLPTMDVSATGYGAGSRDIKARPNLLRVLIGEDVAATAPNRVLQMQANLDRTTPEQIGYLIDQLFGAGALDVFIVPIQMKKNRPAQMLNILCNPEDELILSNIVFSAGVTLGIRKSLLERTVLPRESTFVETKYGKIAVKLAKHDSKTLYFPEYDDVAKAARETGSNFDEIYFEILKQIRKE